MDARKLIISVMEDVQGVAKRDRNQAQGFNFRGIDAVLNHVGPAIRKHGGFIVPSIINSETTVGTLSSGKPTNMVRLHVQFAVYGSEGEPIVGDVAAEAFDTGDKATAKAMSVALRTFLLQLLALPTDEPDPDSFSYEATPAVVDVDALLKTIDSYEGALAVYESERLKGSSQAVLDAIKAKGVALKPAA